MKTRRRVIISLTLLALTLFLAWRFLRPMNIFVVSEAFERPIPTTDIPAPLITLSAKECAGCHPAFYEEWSGSMHSRAWTDPYFQVDWRFDGSQQICKNCHTPLDRQQEHRVLGFRDRNKWKPILAPNPDFDPGLQHEGVTCAVCHFREGRILGPFGNGDAPHPVEKLRDPNQVCVRCHVVGGNRWDTFYRFPPCGTVAEIHATAGAYLNKDQRSVVKGRSGEITISDTESLDCVGCHMPLVERSVVPGGKVRSVRRHLWRGGHDPEMVRQALEVTLNEVPEPASGKRGYVLQLTNVGAAHYLPTGTPDRHLTVRFRLLDQAGNVLKEKSHILKRNFLWRPFIVELWDTRLPRWQPRTYRFEFSTARMPEAAALEAVVRYHLLEESRRRRIGYENEEPISYEVYRRRIFLIKPEAGAEKILDKEVCRSPRISISQALSLQQSYMTFL